MQFYFLTDRQWKWNEKSYETCEFLLPSSIVKGILRRTPSDFCRRTEDRDTIKNKHACKEGYNSTNPFCGEMNFRNSSMRAIVLRFPPPPPPHSKTRMHAHTHTCMYIHAHTYMCMYMHTHMHRTHTHTHMTCTHCYWEKQLWPDLNDGSIVLAILMAEIGHYGSYVFQPHQGFKLWKRYDHIWQSCLTCMKEIWPYLAKLSHLHERDMTIFGKVVSLVWKRYDHIWQSCLTCMKEIWPYLAKLSHLYERDMTIFGKVVSLACGNNSQTWPLQWHPSLEEVYPWPHVHTHTSVVGLMVAGQCSLGQNSSWEPRSLTHKMLIHMSNFAWAIFLAVRNFRGPWPSAKNVEIILHENWCYNIIDSNLAEGLWCK